MNSYRNDTYLRNLRFIEDGNAFGVEGSGLLINKAVISHISDLQNLTLEMLSKDTYLSDASVSRYFKKKGYGSFQAFKGEFASFLVEQRITAIKHGFAKAAEDSVRTGMNTLVTGVSEEGAGAYDRSAEILNDSEHVLFLGEMHELLPFFPLQVSLISSLRGAYFVRCSSLDQFPERLLNGKVCAVVTDSAHAEMKKITDLAKKLGGMRIIALAENYPGKADVTIPFRNSEFLSEQAERYAVHARCMLDAFLRLNGMKP